jgi:hypothetical protein
MCQSNSPHFVDCTVGATTEVLTGDLAGDVATGTPTGDFHMNRNDTVELYLSYYVASVLIGSYERVSLSMGCECWQGILTVN